MKRRTFLLGTAAILATGLPSKESVSLGDCEIEYDQPGEAKAYFVNPAYSAQFSDMVMVSVQKHRYEIAETVMMSNPMLDRLSKAQERVIEE